MNNSYTILTWEISPNFNSTMSTLKLTIKFYEKTKPTKIDKKIQELRDRI